MTYPSVDAKESRVVEPRAVLAAALPSHHGRLYAGLMLAGLLSLMAAFWIAIFRLVAIG